MRILVLFDIPVMTKPQRRIASKFRHFLLKDGYYMLQYSVYARVCNGLDAVEMHRQRLKRALPDNGSVRMLVMTEKQYESMDVLVGKFRYEENPPKNTTEIY